MKEKFVICQFHRDGRREYFTGTLPSWTSSLFMAQTFNMYPTAVEMLETLNGTFAIQKIFTNEI